MLDLVEAHRKVIIEAGLEHSKKLAEANAEYTRTIAESQAKLIYEMQIRLDQFAGTQIVIGGEKEKILEGIDDSIKQLVNQIPEKPDVQF
jgi:hypothetical protein